MLYLPSLYSLQGAREPSQRHRGYGAFSLRTAGQRVQRVNNTAGGLAAAQFPYRMKGQGGRDHNDTVLVGLIIPCCSSKGTVLPELQQNLLMCSVLETVKQNRILQQRARGEGLCMCGRPLFGRACCSEDEASCGASLQRESYMHDQ